MVAREHESPSALAALAPTRPRASFARSAALANIAAVAAVAGGATLLLVRLLGDLTTKPLYEDEGIAGWIASRPLPELVRTTIWERGGAPAHFLLAHLAFAFDASATSLRAVSVVFALLAVGVSFDLGRRLGGQVAGITASVIASTSALLTIYGTVGRMYAMFAFAGGLAADLFVRAVRQRTRASAVAAAAAAWLLPAVHPFGGFLVAIEALAALWIWRGRGFRRALPVVAIGLAMTPFAIGDLQLAGRVSSGVAQPTPLITPRQASVELVQALLGFAGGFTAAALILLPMGIVGAWIVLRKEPAVAAVTVIPLVALAVVAMIVRLPGGEGYSTPRYFIFALPGWSAFIGVTAARIASSGRESFTIGIFAALLAAGAWGTTGKHNSILDPRLAPLWLNSGTARETAAPADWLRARIRRNDVLFPYSSLYLAAFPQAEVASAIDQHYPRSMIESLRHVPMPVRRIFIAIPVPQTRLGLRELQAQLGSRYEVVRFPTWLLISTRRPVRSRERILAVIHLALRATNGALEHPSPALRVFMELATGTVCAADRALSPVAQPACAGGA